MNYRYIVEIKSFGDYDEKYNIPLCIVENKQKANDLVDLLNKIFNEHPMVSQDFGLLVCNSDITDKIKKIFKILFTDYEVSEALIKEFYFIIENNAVYINKKNFFNI